MDSRDYIQNIDILEILARRVKEYRLAARMSQRELAQKSGVSLYHHKPFRAGQES